MSIKRIVDTAFWEDSKVIDKYSVEDKYFLLYLMTNPHTTQVGIYKLPKRLISFETGYTVESVSAILDRFEIKHGNIAYNQDTQEIAVLNSLKYSIVKGGKPVSDLLEKELAKVEDDELILKVYHKLTKFWQLSIRPFDESVKELFEEELKKRNVPIIFNDNDNDNDNEESYHESYNESYHESSSNKKHIVEQIPFSKIINYLNEQTGKRYKVTQKWKDLIKARWNEGQRIDDFKKVIDVKCSQWLNDSNMNKYLRPQTLFGNKFDEYLNEYVPKIESSRISDIERTQRELREVYEQQ